MISRLLTAAACLACAVDLSAQRPRRFPAPAGPPAGQAPAQSPQAATTASGAVESWTALVGGDVHVGTGEVIRRATVLIGDDKIHSVGHNLELPEGTKVIDASGKVVSPGFIAVKLSGVGVQGGAPAPLADAANPFDPTMKLGLAAGITSYLSLSGSGSNTPGGSGAVVKLAYGDLKGIVAEESVVQTMSVPLDPAAMKSFRDLVQKANEWRNRPATPAQPAPAAQGGRPAPQGGPPQQGGRGAAPANTPPAGTDGVLKIMEGKVRLWITCRGPFGNEAIRQAMEISSVLGVGVVLDMPITAWTMAEEIAATGSMAIVSPRQQVTRDPARPTESGSNMAQAAILAAAGVPVAVTPSPGGFGGGPSIGTGGLLGQDLNTPHIDAAYAVRGGMDNRRALRTLTLDAARIVGLDRRIGSIEQGKDADILILDGDPLHYKTFVQVAIVNGKVVYEKDRETYYDHVRR